MDGTIPKDKELLKEILKRFANANISKQEMVSIINEIKTDELPVELFKMHELSNLEAIVKYLRENKKMTYKEIGKRLRRNPATLAVSYKNAKKKMPQELQVTETQTIPFSAFKNRLSILESAALHFKHQGMKQIEIAEVLGKHPKTIGTVIRRAHTKT